MDGDDELPARRKAQAKRIVDFHQSRMAEYVQKHATSPGNEKPFRYHLTGGVDCSPPHLRKRPRPTSLPGAAKTQSKAESSSLSALSQAESEGSQKLIGEDLIGRSRGPLAVGGQPVAPPVRLRHPNRVPPGSPPLGSSPPACSSTDTGSSTSVPRRRGGAKSASPRQQLRSLPPIVYERIDEALRGGHLPAAWFFDHEPLHQSQEDERCLPQSARNSPDESSFGNSSLQSGLEGETGACVFEPPMRARSQYIVHRDNGRQEWRPCEVLSYHPSEQRYLIRWGFGNDIEKKVSALQLILDGESQADAESRHAEAQRRRDVAEAKLIEQLVIEELSRWEVGTMSSDGNQMTSVGSSMDRILKNAKPQDYGASDRVIGDLMREVRQNYCQAQAKSILFWNRSDLQDSLGNAMLEQSSNERRGPGSAESTRTGSKESSSAGTAVGEDPGLDIHERILDLRRQILVGSPSRRDRLIRVFNLCGEIVCSGTPEMFLLGRKLEPYSLEQIARLVTDNGSLFYSQYRTTWPEKITQVFLNPPGAPWCQRMSELVSKWMEVCLHDLCLDSLRKLVEMVRHYAQLSEDIRNHELVLTYVPPPVYKRTQICEYERHPLFRVHVCVEFAGADFNAGAELAVEAFFAAADMKTVESMISSRERFDEATDQVRTRHRDEMGAFPVGMYPDGGSGGGAATAAYVAIQAGTASYATMIATNLNVDKNETPSTPDDEESKHVEYEAVIDDALSGSVLFADRGLCVRLSSHPHAFQEVLSKHFRKVVELTDNFSRIDGYLQMDGEVCLRNLQGLQEVHEREVRELEEEFQEQVERCFFDAGDVVQEVRHFRCLLSRFAGQFGQIKAMLRPPQPPPAPAAAEGDAAGRVSPTATSGTWASSSAAADDVADTTPGGGTAGAVSGGGPAEEIAAESESADADSSTQDDKYVTGIVFSIDELEDHLQKIDSWFVALKDTQDLSERHLGLFVIDATPLRRALVAMCACCRLRLLGCTQRRLEEECQILLKGLQSKHSEIVMLPRTADELQSTLEAVNGLDVFLREKQPQLKRIQEIFQLLHRWSHQVPKSLLHRWYDCIHAVPDLRDRAERWRNVFRRDLRGRFNLKIAEEAKKLETQCIECKKGLDELASKVSLNKAEFYHSKMKQLQQRMRGIQDQVKKQHLHEEMMDMEPTEFPWLTSMVEQIVPLLELWYLAHEWIQWKDEILFGEFCRIDPESVKVKLTSCTETMRRLEEVFVSQPRPRQVLHSLSLELTELRVLLPVIISLRNPGLRERHWQLIGEAIDQNIQISQMRDISLSVMNERYPFVTHLSKIQEISDTAAREMLIEDELQRMQEQWSRLPILIEPIKASSVRTPSEHSGGEYGDEEEEITYKADFRYVEVWELITEQMSKVKLMAQSPYAAVHSTQLVKHDEKLKLIGELCDLLHETQYGYLASRPQLMTDGIVQDLLQKEGNREYRRFFDVDKHWQQIMTMLHSNPSWLVLLDVSRILESCRESAAVMDRILKAVHDVLDRRRLQVPLMYRLNDAQLMQLLLRGHDPSMPAVRCCFPSVLAFDVLQPDPRREKRSIRGIVGKSGEYLPMTVEVQTDEGEKIEDWVTALQESMRLSLKSALTGVMAEGVNITADNLLSEHIPMQIRCAIIDIILTGEVEEILDRQEPNINALQKRRMMCAHCIEQIHRKKLQNIEENEEDEESEEEEDEEFEDSEDSEEDSDEDEEDAEPADKSLDEMEVVEEGEEKEEDDEDDEAERQEAEDAFDDNASGKSNESATMVFNEGIVTDPNRLKVAIERRNQVVAGLLPESECKTLSKHLLSIGAVTLIQKMLNWRDVIDDLVEQRMPGISSHQWTMVLRHYLDAAALAEPPNPASKAADSPGGPKTVKYALHHGGYEMQYGWQYLGESTQVYLNPMTTRGVLAVAHAFASHRGILATSPRVGGRKEAVSGLATTLGIVEERCFVHWDSTHVQIMKHVTGAVLAGVWLTLVVDQSANLQVLAVLAQELSNMLDAKRRKHASWQPLAAKRKSTRNLTKGGTRASQAAITAKGKSGGWQDMVMMTSYITLQCNEAMLSGQQLPLLLLQTFRPYSMPRPNVTALCSLWLLTSGLAHSYTIKLAKACVTVWKFSEDTGLGSLTQHGHQLCAHATHRLGIKGSGNSLLSLRLLCDLTVKIAAAIGKGRRPSMKPVTWTQRPSYSLGADRLAPQIVAVPQETEAPTWARVALLRAYMALFESNYYDALKKPQEAKTQLQALLNLTDDDLKTGQQAWDMFDVETEIRHAFTDLGLLPVDRQVTATYQMHFWCRLGGAADSLARGVMILGGPAVGKSACVDALIRSWTAHNEEWEVRRLSAASLTLDAADTLNRPIDAMPRLTPPVKDAGVLESFDDPDTGDGMSEPSGPPCTLVHVDGELGPSLQGAFLGALVDAPPPSGSLPWPGLYLSNQSWLTTASGHSVGKGMLRFVFELDTEGSRSLGPDLVTRCGTIFLGTGDDNDEERSAIISGWVLQVRSDFGEVFGDLVDTLCNCVLEPLILLLYGDVDEPEASAPAEKGAAAEGAGGVSFQDHPRRASFKLPPASSPKERAQYVLTSSKDAVRKHKLVGDLKQLRSERTWPDIPRRIALLHVRDAFLALFNSWQDQVETQRANQSMQQEFNQRKPGHRRVSNPHGAKGEMRRSIHREESAGGKSSPPGQSTSPLATPSTTEEKRHSASPDGSAEVAAEQQETGPSSPSNATQSTREAATAFVFAVAWGLAPLINKSAHPMLEEALVRLLEQEQSTEVRLPAEYSIFDAVPAGNLRHFQHIDWILTPLEKADIDAYVYVPTPDARRFLSLATVLSRSQTHMALLGPAGCGKTLALGAFFSNLPLKSSPPALPASYAIHGVPAKPRGAFGSVAELRYMSVGPWTPMGRWERLLQKPLVNSSRHSIRPALGVWCLCVVDDVHCGPAPMNDSYRFALERGLVHTPGACAGPAARSSAMRTSGTTATGTGGRKVTERPEREALAPGIRYLDGVMLLLVARTGTAFCKQQSLLRHCWLNVLDHVSASEMENIVGDNVSHFIYVNDLPSAISARKMRYVRLVHGWMLKLKERTETASLVTPHVLFRFFKSLLCLPTEWLCELSPTSFHALVLHELIRETVDRLPAPKLQSEALKSLATIQLKIFGGMEDSIHPSPGGHIHENDEEHGGDMSGANEDHTEPLDGQVDEMAKALRKLHFSVLRPLARPANEGENKSKGFQPHVEDSHIYSDVSNAFTSLNHGIGKDLVSGWHAHNYVPPLVWSLVGNVDHELMDPFLMDLEDTVGLEPHHAIIYKDFSRHLLSLARLLHHAGGKGRYHIWGRSGGKTLICTPCVSSAIAIVKAMAHLGRISWDMPGGSSTFKDGQTAALMSPDELRSWLKERLFMAVTERSTMMACLPPQVLDRPELLAVLHEAFAYEGAPEDWYTEKERRECESALTALELQRARIAGNKSMQHQDDDSQSAHSLFEQFWSEALSMTHFVLLAEITHDSERISASTYFDVQTLDAHCPTLLQQLAVIQIEPLDVAGLVDVASFYIDTPAFDLQAWQPDTSHRLRYNARLISEVAACIFNSSRHAQAAEPSGYAPTPVHLAPGLAGRSVPTGGPAEAAVPNLPRCTSSWTGQGVDMGISAKPFQALGDLADLLSLAQGLCKLKGQQLKEKHDVLQDSQLILELVHHSLITGDGGEGERRLLSAVETWRVSAKEVEEKKKTFTEHQKKLTTITEEVIDRCGSARVQFEATETLCVQAAKELELSRIQLVNFSKSEQNELRNLVRTHVAQAPSGADGDRSAVYNLFEMCCIALRVSARPTREEVRQTMSDALFNTKLAAIDTEALTAEHVAAMEAIIQTTDRTEFGEVRTLAMIANVAFPIFAVASTSIRLPQLKAEVEHLTTQRETRGQEVEELQALAITLEADLRQSQEQEEKHREEMRAAENWVKSSGERTNRATSFMNAASNERARWQTELEDLQEKLRCLVGDCMLSAASALYLGPYNSQHRAQLVAHWCEVLRQAKVRHSENWNLCDQWLPPTSRHRWHAEHNLPPDAHLVQSVVLAMLQGTTWPLLYDPDGIAAEFFSSLLPQAVTLTMGTADFREKLLAALIDTHKDDDGYGLPPTGGQRQTSSLLGTEPHVIIIENTYLPALRETDLLMELLPRGKMHRGGNLIYQGDQDAIHVKSNLMLIFVTKMGEPVSKDNLAAKLGLVDFRVTGGDGLSHEFFADLLLKHCCYSSHSEWQQMLIERAQLMDDWERIDEQLAKMLAPNLVEGQMSREFFHTEDNVNIFVGIKSELTKVERKLLKNRDMEAQKLQARKSYDHFAAILCSLAQCCDRIRWLCPHANVSTAAFLEILREKMPPAPEGSGMKEKGRFHEGGDNGLGEAGAEGEWMVAARTAVVQALWDRCCFGLPEHSVLPMALHLAIGSSIPHQAVQGIFARVLLQCPAADKRILASELPEFCKVGAATFTAAAPGQSGGGIGFATGRQTVRLRMERSVPLQERRRQLMASKDQSNHWSSPMEGSATAYSQNVPTVEERFVVNVTTEEKREARKSVALAGIGAAEDGDFGPEDRLSAVATPAPADDDDEEDIDVMGFANARSSFVSSDRAGEENSGEDALTSSARMFVINDLWYPKPSQTVMLARATYFLGIFRMLVQQLQLSQAGSAEGADAAAGSAGNVNNEDLAPDSTTARDAREINSRDEAREARDALAALPMLYQIAHVSAEKAPEKLEALLKRIHGRGHGAVNDWTETSMSLESNDRLVNAQIESSPSARRMRGRMNTLDGALMKSAAAAAESAAPTSAETATFLEGTNESTQFLSFHWQYTHPDKSAIPTSINVEWMALRGLLDRLEDSLVMHADKWLAWAESVANGDLRKASKTEGADGEDEDKGDDERPTSPQTGKKSVIVDYYPLLQSLPDELLSALAPQVARGPVTLQLVSVLATVQVLALVVLLCHGLPSLLAGTEAVVDALVEVNSLSVPCDGLRGVLRNTRNVQPVICLCESEASSAYKEIIAQSERYPSAPKIVPISMAGTVATGSTGSGPSMTCAAAAAAPSAPVLIDMLEEAKDVGHWVVVHFTSLGATGGGSDSSSGVHLGMWDPYELLERCWFFCAGLRELFVHEKFRLFLIVDFRASQYLPRWLFDSRAITFFDGQSGSQIRHWFEHLVNEMKPMPGGSNRKSTNLTEAMMALCGQQVARPSLIRLSGHQKAKRESKRLGSTASTSTIPGGPRGSATTFKRHLGSLSLGSNLSMSTGTAEAAKSDSAIDTIATFFRDSAIQVEGKPLPIGDSNLLTSPTVNISKPAGLGSTSYRLLMQLALAVLAAGEPSVVGSFPLLVNTPVLGRADAQLADSILVQLLGRSQESTRSQRLADTFEVLAVLVLRLGAHNSGTAGVSNTLAPPALHMLLQKLQQAWFLKNYQMAQELGSSGKVNSAENHAAREFSDLVTSTQAGLNFLNTPPSGDMPGPSRTASILRTGASTAMRTPSSKSIMILRTGPTEEVPAEEEEVEENMNLKSKPLLQVHAAKSTAMSRLVDCLERRWKLERTMGESTAIADADDLEEQREACESIARAVRVLPLRDHDALLHVTGADRCALFLALPFVAPLRAELKLPKLKDADKAAALALRKRSRKFQRRNTDHLRFNSNMGENGPKRSITFGKVLTETCASEISVSSSGSEKPSSAPGSLRSEKGGLKRSGVNKDSDFEVAVATEAVSLNTRKHSLAKKELADLFQAVIDCIEASPVVEDLLDTKSSEATLSRQSSAGSMISASQVLAPAPEITVASPTGSLAGGSNQTLRSVVEAAISGAQPADKQADTPKLQAEWSRQRGKIAVQARAVLNEAKEMLHGINVGFTPLGERLVLKLRHLLHCYDIGAPEISVGATSVGPQWGQPPLASFGDTCPENVKEAAKSKIALALPAPAGWDHPDYAPSQCFGHWLCSMAHRLHDVYAPRIVPTEMSVPGLARITPLLCAMQLELAARLRVGIERVCLLFEPVYGDKRGTKWDKLDEEVPPSFRVVSPIPTAEGATPSFPSSWGRASMGPDSTMNSVAPSPLPSRPPSADRRSKGDDRQARRKSTLQGQSQAADRLRAALSAHGFDSSAARQAKTESRRGTLLTGALETGGPLSRGSGGSSGSGGSRRSIVSNRRTSVWKVGKPRSAQKEVGHDEIVLTNLLVDGAVWSTVSGLHVDRSIRGLTRLPPLRVRAATPRAAEFIVHQRFPNSHGCLELKVNRVLQSPWLMSGAVNSSVQVAEMLTVTLPFIWGNLTHKWHPVALFESLPPSPADPCLCLTPPQPESGGASGLGETTGAAGSSEWGGKQPSVESRVRGPIWIARPFSLHPAAASGLLAGFAPSACAPSGESS